MCSPSFLHRIQAEHRILFSEFRYRADPVGAVELHAQPEDHLPVRSQCAHRYAEGRLLLSGVHTAVHLGRRRFDRYRLECLSCRDSGHVSQFCDRIYFPAFLCLRQKSGYREKISKKRHGKPVSFLFYRIPTITVSTANRTTVISVMADNAAEVCTRSSGSSAKTGMT